MRRSRHLSPFTYQNGVRWYFLLQSSYYFTLPTLCRLQRMRVNSDEDRTIFIMAVLPVLFSTHELLNPLSDYSSIFKSFISISALQIVVYSDTTKIQFSKNYYTLKIPRRVSSLQITNTPIYSKGSQHCAIHVNTVYK